MPRNVKLLLTETVEALGIVGDVVNVRTGYARNFLLPRNMATQPNDEKIKELAGKRAEAEKMLSDVRAQREQMIGKLNGIELTIVRPCNDQGHLYGAVTQQEIAAVIAGMGHAVKARDIRLHQVIKRVDTFDVHVKLDSDLDAHLRLHIKPDRKLDHKDGGEESVAASSAHAPSSAQSEAAPTTKPGTFAEKPGKGEKAVKSDKSDKPEKSDKGKADAKSEKHSKADKHEGKSKHGQKAEKGDKKKK